MCFHEEESIDHLFVHCQWVSSLWALALSLMDVSWLQSSNVKDVLVAWRKRLKKCWVHDLEVDTYSYLVVYMKREESADFR